MNLATWNNLDESSKLNIGQNKNKLLPIMIQFLLKKIDCIIKKNTLFKDTRYMGYKIN